MGVGLYSAGRVSTASNRIPFPSGFFNKATEDSMFSNVIDLLFNCAAFIYIGAIIPFSDFGDAAIGVSSVLDESHRPLLMSLPVHRCPSGA